MRSRTRDRKGATTIALVLVLAFFVILPLGLLGYEISRFLLVEQMLRGASNAAALAGSAAMASSNFNNTYSNREDWAMYIAGYTFQQNSILNIPMTPAGSTGAQNVNLYGCTTPIVGFNNMAADLGATPSTNVPLWITPPYQQAALNIALVNTSNQMVDDQGSGTDTLPGPGGGTISGVAAQVVVIAYYTDRASFSSNLLPVGNFTAVSISRGGLPIIDMDLCFDVSASMDDESPCLFVNRFWNPTQGARGKMNWTVVDPIGRAAGSPPANTIFSELGPNVTGTPVNIEPPQNLSAASIQKSGGYPTQKGNTWYPLWSELNVAGPPPYTSSYVGLRSGYSCVSGSPVQNGNGYTAALCQPGGPSPSTAFEQGFPPGNFNYLNTKVDYAAFSGNPVESAKTSGDLAVFTDLVFDIPVAAASGAPFQTLPWQTIDFTDGGGVGSITVPQIAFLVEASRGNLETAAILNKAVGVVTPAGGVIAPATPTAASYGLKATPGAYQAYWSYVVNNAQPIATARVAADEFFQTMHISANSHFGLICFSDSEASPPSNPGTLTNPWTAPAGGGGYTPATDYNYNIDGSYKAGNGITGYTAGTFLVPGVALDPANDNWSNGNVVQVLLGSTAGTADPVCSIVGNAVTYNNNSPQCVGGGAAQSPPCILALGETDINGALTSAYNDIKANARPNATNKAIVLFTDGVSDVPDYATGLSNALGTAFTIGKNNVPVYTIGLATNTAIQPYEDIMLSDNINHFSGDPAQQGIAYQAFTGGAQQSQYFPALTTTLNAAFQAVARSLCILQ